MPVGIFGVEENSAFFKLGIKKGDRLVSLNGNEIYDVFDYQFHCDNDTLSFKIEKPDGKAIFLKLNNKTRSLHSQLFFETYLMDTHQHCKNKCIFCFIDQLPEGMRESLYFKDDDSRLSFLFGNYITLSGISEREVLRIIEMKISPVNISVHTMNPALRVKMMGNPNAGENLKLLHRFAENGIKMNTQLVLCPGINDGGELRFSLEELSKLYPTLESIAVIPVGLTKHREKLYKLRPYTAEEAREVIKTVDEFNEHFAYFNRRFLAYTADEFYLKAGMEMPSTEYYGDFPQLDNGVGLWALMREEFFAALHKTDSKTKIKKRKTALITGAAAYPLMTELIRAFKEKFNTEDFTVFSVKNDFFGSEVTVAGLVTGKDIIAQLKGKIKADEILIPQVMLKSKEEPIFLDGTSLTEIECTFRAKIIPVMNDGAELLRRLVGKENPSIEIN